MLQLKPQGAINAASIFLPLYQACGHFPFVSLSLSGTASLDTMNAQPCPALASVQLSWLPQPVYPEA
jgi:hypothetical protein